MVKERNINILMLDKQAVKIGDLLVEFLNSSVKGHVYALNYCSSYREGLSMLQGIDIALVELDMTKEYFAAADKDFLPWISEDNAGYRFLTHLKKEHPDVKVIMLVDYPACEDVSSKLSEIIDKGADGYVVKPFVLSKLVDEIHRVSINASVGEGEPVSY